MRYHHEKPSLYVGMFGKVYWCDHPVYNKCTLYKIGDKGLAVIQQRYEKISKKTYWTDIDKWLIDAIYLNSKFIEFFNKYAGVPSNGLYPTVTIRQIMWALKMKPILREQWETTFDHKNI